MVAEGRSLDQMGRTYVAAWRAMSQAEIQLRLAERTYRETLHRPLIALELEKIANQLAELIDREG